MVGESMRTAWLAILMLSGGCFDSRTFQCESDDQCLASPSGVCEAAQWCSYPDTACDGGRAYGPHAPPDVAGACVPPSEPGTTGTGTSTASTDDGQTSLDESSDSSTGGDEIPVLCGDGKLDPGEDCDDNNREPDDGCHPLCVDPGTPAWTRNYDGEVNGEDRGFGIALDETRDAIYVTGYTTVTDPDTDILIQRWRLETGELEWSRVVDGGVLGDDQGEHVEVDSRGNVVVAGVATVAEGDTAAWLAKFDPDGKVLWQRMDPDTGGDKAGGVAVGQDDRIIVVGRADRTGYDEAWMQWFTTEGEPDGEPVFRGDLPSSEAIDVIAVGDEFQVTGSLQLEPDEPYVWTARYGADRMPRWEHLLGEQELGNTARGVGQAFDPLGGSAMAGVLLNDILVQRYDDMGELVQTLAESGESDKHDEAADIAFLPDGRFIVVGFVDFATVGFATSNSWVRLYSPTGETLWSDRFDGEAMEIDKALGVALTSHSAVVVGYETVPGQSRDVWLRRYAI